MKMTGEVAKWPGDILDQLRKVFGFSGLLVEPNRDGKASDAANEAPKACGTNLKRR
jgi:hypothetical protein